jgi:5,10-methylenetetrahydromethanopterin reductase
MTTIRLGQGLHWLNESLDEFVELIQQSEELGYEFLWAANEKFFRDMYVMATLAALKTTRPYIGTFVADPYSHHPALTAVAVASLDQVSRGRAILCFGAGGTGFPPMGIQRTKPALAIKEAILLVRELWTGKTVDFDGQVIHFRHGRLNFEARPDIPIYVASRGDLVLRSAGEVADGVMIATYAEPRGIQHALDRVAEGASRSGRALSDLVLISRVDACISEDRRLAIEAVKPMVGVFLWTSFPDRAFVHRVGLEVPDELEAIIAKRDYNLMAPNAHLIPDTFVERFCWAGTPKDVAEQVARVVDMGIDQITFLPHPPRGGNTRETISKFAEEVKPRVEAMLRG